MVDFPVVPQRAVDAPESLHNSPRDSVGAAKGSTQTELEAVSVLTQSHDPISQRDDSVGAAGAAHRRNDGHTSCATESKFPTVLRRRSVITQRQVPTTQKIEKTLEIHQVQFEVVDVPVVMHYRSLRFRSAGDHGEPTGRVH